MSGADATVAAFGALKVGAADGYPTREAAELVGLKPRTVRHYVERGLLAPARGPKGEYRFSFRDLVLLKTAKGLLDADVSSRRAMAALSKLKQTVGALDGKELTAMRIFADGNTVVVREDDALWDAETGQGRFTFANPNGRHTVRAGEVRRLARRADAEDPDAAASFDSDDWYNLGLDLEEAEPARAPAAYRRAISLDPENADAHVNLGRLFQVRGDLRRAKRHYQRALSAAPLHQLAYYNLGTLFDELDELDTALDYYCRAPNVPDAHYNQARIFEMRGDQLAFARHMREYRVLVRNE